MHEYVKEAGPPAKIYYALLAIKMYSLIDKADDSKLKEEALQIIDENSYALSSKNKKYAKRILDELSNNRKSKKTLESKSLLATGIISILASIFFLSPNLTGNTIGNITSSNTNFLGAVLFVLGIGMIILKKKI